MTSGRNGGAQPSASNGNTTVTVRVAVAMRPNDTDKPETVLVVEDDVITRLVLADYLRQCGYRVFEAAGGEEALSVLAHPDWPVDVVLTHAGSEGSSDGFSLARHIRARYPAVEVILAGTPSGAAEAAGDLCERGPELARPYDPKLAVEKIRALRRGNGERRGEPAYLSFG